jgi:hypothetical protein
MSLKPAQKDWLVTRPLHAPRGSGKSSHLNNGIFSDVACLSCEAGVFGVDPTRLELVTSAMRGRSEGFAAVHYRSKNRLNKSNPRIVPPRMFAIVRAGCRQIVVSCISKYWASKETLFIDQQVYSTPVHVVLEGSVQEAQERMSCRQQTGSMQDPANGLPRMPLPRTPVNKGQ